MARNKDRKSCVPRNSQRSPEYAASAKLQGESGSCTTKLSTASSRPQMHMFSNSGTPVVTHLVKLKFYTEQEILII